MRLSRRLTLTATAGAVLLATAGAVTAHRLTDPARGLTAAKGAGDAHCRQVTRKAPERLAGKERRSVGLAGVVVWGGQDVILRCGVTAPTVTKDPCFEADGVDWVLDARQSTPERQVLVTFGRTPATQVAIRPGGVPTDEALLDLSHLVTATPKTDECRTAH
ncbi:DUF3515 family protein [Streptomyces sp. L2]|uniref:DUF3515 family protein n=1 Tax=Streptomyces sp. L2 TaxID=2162665 RepID=UPI0013E964CD|nr:DUF3515 family protein [Streptomyces sp. L2]